MLRAVFTVVVAAAAGAPLQSLPRAQTYGSLDRRAVEDAIRFGRDHEPQPYLLYHAAGDNGVSSAIVGCVYTPFLRIAFASHAAASRGEPFTASDVSPDLVRAELYVALRWYCCRPAGGHDAGHPSALSIALPGEPIAANGHVYAAPLWVTHDTSPLARFGAEAPYPDIAVVAGYDMRSLAVRSDYIIYRDLRSSTGQLVRREIEIGRPPSDWKAWR